MTDLLAGEMILNTFWNPYIENFRSLPPMKTLAAALFFLCATSALASEPKLLQDALSCKLKDSDLKSLMRELGARQPGLAKPAVQMGAPSADIYRLSQPVSALGYSSNEVVVTPARILLAVPGETLGQATKKLKLAEEAYAPARREVRPTVGVVAFQLSHQALENKVLVGCEYQNADAAAWVRN